MKNQTKHAYTITGVESEKYNIIRIRNPYGVDSYEWKGGNEHHIIFCSK